MKTLTSQKRRALLTARKLLQEKAIAVENDIRGLLRNFGLKVGVVGLIKFEERIVELVEGLPDLAEIMASLLEARRTLREQVGKLHQRLLSIVREDDTCRRLMTIPGVGPIVSLAFVATIDIPARFRLQGRRAGIGIDADPQSIGREQSRWPKSPVRLLIPIQAAHQNEMIRPP